MWAQQARDGFDTFNDAIESDDAEQASSSSASIIRGNQLKYGDAKTPFKWLDKSTGKPFSLERVLVAIDLRYAWCKSGRRKTTTVRPRTRMLAPDEKFPDVDKLNAETPETEWRMGPDGKPKGPYETAFVLYLLDAETMERFTYVASTIGGKRAVRELRDRVDWMRKVPRRQRLCGSCPCRRFHADGLRWSPAATLRDHALDSVRRRRHPAAGP